MSKTETRMACMMEIEPSMLDLTLVPNLMPQPSVNHLLMFIIRFPSQDNKDKDS